MAQSWSATSLWMYPVPVTNIDGCVAVSIPTSHDKNTRIAILTTTNTPALLGDLLGATISATIEVTTSLNPKLIYGNDCGSPPYGNVRLYLTTTADPYNFFDGMANETEYWWADFAMTTLSVSNPGQMIPGTSILTAALDPTLWSDANGHYASDPAYIGAFFRAVSHIAQIGLSFGGGCYFDIGVGISNYDDPWPWPTAMFYVRDFRILRPALTVTSYDPVQGTVLSLTNTIPTQCYTFTVQHSDDLCTWSNLTSIVVSGAPPLMTDTSATNSTTRFYRLR